MEDISLEERLSGERWRKRADFIGKRGGYDVARNGASSMSVDVCLRVRGRSAAGQLRVTPRKSWGNCTCVARIDLA